MAQERNRTAEVMRRLGIPLTRDNFIAFNWPEPPEEWTAEHEEELPAQLQDWAQFGLPADKA